MERVHAFHVHGLVVDRGELHLAYPRSGAFLRGATDARGDAHLLVVLENSDDFERYDGIFHRRVLKVME